MTDISRKELIVLDCDAKSFDEVVSIAGGKLFDLGYVKDSYIKAVQDREKVFPTGLQTALVNVGMPHTDPEHVNKTGITFVRTQNPVEISMMGSPNTKLDASIFFVLSVLDPESYMSFLSKLMGLFQDDEVLETLSKTQDSDYILNVLNALNA